MASCRKQKSPAARTTGLHLFWQRELSDLRVSRLFLFFARNHSLLEIRFDLSEDLLVAYDRRVECVEQSLCRNKVQCDTLIDFDGLVIGTHGLCVQTEIDNQFFWSSDNADEV